MDSINKNSWEKIFQLPFQSNLVYATSKNGIKVICLNKYCSLYGENIETVLKDIVDIINGYKESDSPCAWAIKDLSKFYKNDKYMFTIKGWEYLVSDMFLFLDGDDANTIMEEFANYILKRLNNEKET